MDNYISLLWNRQFYDQEIYLHFHKDTKPKRLKHLCLRYIFDKNINQLERLLYIKGLEYKVNKYTNIEIYLYTLLDFDRYMTIFKYLYPKNDVRYNREEVIDYYDNL